jgi:hypothetical protein
MTQEENVKYIGLVTSTIISNIIPNHRNKFNIDMKKIEQLKIEDLKSINTNFDLPPFLDSLEKYKKETKRVVHAFNLIHSCLQFQFFLGRAENYPHDEKGTKIDSQWLISTLDNVFKDCNVFDPIFLGDSNVINLFKQRLLESNITKLEERLNILDQLLKADILQEYSIHYNNPYRSLELIYKIQNMKKDPYKKKAIFALMMTDRYINSKNQVNKNILTRDLPIPSDYRIPNVLFNLGFIFEGFGAEINFINKLQSNEHIIENSELEMNYRSIAIEACNLIAEHLDISTNEVDALLFDMRHDNKAYRHHICDTTNY